MMVRRAEFFLSARELHLSTRTGLKGLHQTRTAHASSQTEPELDTAPIEDQHSRSWKMSAVIFTTRPQHGRGHQDQRHQRLQLGQEEAKVDAEDIPNLKKSTIEQRGGTSLLSPCLSHDHQHALATLTKCCASGSFSRAAELSWRLHLCQMSKLQMPW